MDDEPSLGEAWLQLERELLKLVHARAQLQQLLGSLPHLEQHLRRLGLRATSRALAEEMAGLHPEIDFRILARLQGQTNLSIEELRSHLTELMHHVDGILAPWLARPNANGEG